MQFTAIDVETANPDMGSICQIGIARFTGGKLVDEWSTLVDPEDYFDDINVSIHGIEPRMVKGQPKLPDIAESLRTYLENTVSVCHTHFDRIALTRAFTKYSLIPIAASWLDSARVVRRAWKDLAWSGYGLANVCNRIGYEFKHHDALEDAKAAGYVLLAAMRESQLDLDAWKRRVNQPIDPERSSSGKAICRDGNPEGDLFGEIVVFTGALELPRREAADLAASIGCRVDPGVTKKTTILVVGDQDVMRLAGQEKSAKHRKAEQLAAEGHPIRIIRETDFRTLVRSAQANYA
jgi:DNA polymerase-3 subunit epsilon